MAPPVVIRWLAVVSSLLLFQLITQSTAIYCDEDDCYDLLGKAYYKLSLKHHSDKNPDSESKKLFVKIANAYEILKDEASREQYDYAIAHPEEVFYNTARCYQAYYGHKTDPRAVLVGLLLILSAFQYLNQWTRYNQAVDMVKKTPAYKNRLRALELERTGRTTNKKKSNRQMNKKVEEDLGSELELQINGAGLFNFFQHQDLHRCPCPQWRLLQSSTPLHLLKHYSSKKIYIYKELWCIWHHVQKKKKKKKKKQMY
ncbi:unnamed protein product [Malus baccata var. baccata]